MRTNSDPCGFEPCQSRAESGTTEHAWLRFESRHARYHPIRLLTRGQYPHHATVHSTTVPTGYAVRLGW